MRLCGAVRFDASNARTPIHKHERPPQKILAAIQPRSRPTTTFEKISALPRKVWPSDCRLAKTGVA